MITAREFKNVICILLAIAIADGSVLAHSSQHDFKMLISPESSICEQTPDLFLLVYVHSAPGNFKKRLTIRQTWASRSLFEDVQIIFVMGVSKQAGVNELLKLEADLYGDIVQEDFQDTYRNLTYKGIAALKWLSRHCDHKAKFVLKSDDDIIVNMFHLHRHLKRLLVYDPSIENRTIMCYVYKRMRVIRKKTSKWYVSKREYKDDRFKTYCSGAAFVLSSDLVTSMYEASLDVDFFWIDDYYITGLLAYKVNASFRHFNTLYIFAPKQVESYFVHKKTDSIVFGHFSHLSDAINQMMFIWDYLKSVFSSS